VDRAARGVRREDPRGQLVVAVALGGRAQRLEQRAPDAAALGGRGDVHAVLPHPLVDAAVRVAAHAREADDDPAVLGDEEQAPLLQPRGDLLLRARARLERRLPAGDPLVVDRGHRGDVGRCGGTELHGAAG
jgi:hypothetical protein